MLGFLGNIGDLDVLFMLIVSLLVLILPCWLIIEIIKYLRRH